MLNPADDFGTFDYGLSPEEERRAARLHAGSIIIDLLTQGPCGYRAFDDEDNAVLRASWEKHRDVARTCRLAEVLPVRNQLSGRSAVFQGHWEGSGMTGLSRDVDLENWEGTFRDFAITVVAADRLPFFIKALRADDFRRAKAEGRRAGFINTQAVDGLGGSPEILQVVHEMGIRMIMLTYNRMNFIGAGCTERTDAGVSNNGAVFIRRMNELGIIVDTSHCGRQTTLDACAISSQPVIASHTSAEAVYKVDRAKSDEELRAIVATGGVVGVYTVPFFLAAGPGVTIEAMLDHIDYISSLVGAENVAIGTDWPMSMPKWVLAEVFAPWTIEHGFRPEHNIDVLTNCIGFDDYRDFPNITRGLVKRGYTDAQVQGILGLNFLRVFEQVCG